MGGRKATRAAAGRPLAAYPADALASVADVVAVVGKSRDDLPALEGVEVWDDEPVEPRHPAAGIAHALGRAGGRDILVCAADMPFVGEAECRSIAAAAAGDEGSLASAVLAAAGGEVEPLLGIYRADARDLLLRGAIEGEPTRSIAAALEPVVVELDQAALRSVNTPEALAAADRELRQPRSRT